MSGEFLRQLYVKNDQEMFPVTFVMEFDVKVDHSLETSLTHLNK